MVADVEVEVILMGCSNSKTIAELENRVLYSPLDKNGRILGDALIYRIGGTVLWVEGSDTIQILDNKSKRMFVRAPKGSETSVRLIQK